MSLEALHAVDVFSQQPASALARLGTDVANVLGKDWSPEQGSSEPGLGLLHRPTALSFVVVPGGTFEMGLTRADEEALREQVPFDEDLARYFEKISRGWCPSHPVQVKPFVVQRRLLSHSDVERLAGSVPGMTTGQRDVRAAREECRGLGHHLGFRLPSEAELEWLARDGGRFSFTLDAMQYVAKGEGDSTRILSRFGVQELFDGEWAEDDYHDGYDGAPAGSDPWVDGGKLGVHRGGALPEYADGPQQMLPLLACTRYPEVGQPPGRPEREHMRLALTIQAAVSA